MAATIPSTSLVPVQPAFTESGRLALAGYLAGYRGLTREAYTLDLRQFTGWCRSQSLPLFAVRRADIEMFARELEAKGRAGLPSPAGCARSPGSASTQSKRSSWITRPRRWPPPTRPAMARSLTNPAAERNPVQRSRTAVLRGAEFLDVST